jgi:DNA-binding GntR family transcriptional regulator
MRPSNLAVTCDADGFADSTSPGDLSDLESVDPHRLTGRAIHVLREEGLIYTVQGEGTFVGPDEAPRAQRKIPMYRQIARDMVEAIKAGRYQPRRRIPGETALVQRYDVARETARRAVALLREEGWIYTIAQRGSYVSPKESWPGE